MRACPASPAERAQVHEVARCIAPHLANGESWLTVLAGVSRWFPGISLRAALAAYVFGDAILAEQPPRRLRARCFTGPDEGGNA